MSFTIEEVTRESQFALDRARKDFLYKETITKLYDALKNDDAGDNQGIGQVLCNYMASITTFDEFRHGLSHVVYYLNDKKAFGEGTFSKVILPHIRKAILASAEAIATLLASDKSSGDRALLLLAVIIADEVENFSIKMQGGVF